MTLQPHRPLIDALRDVLRRMEEDPDSDTPRLADLKRIIRERIASIEGTQRLRIGSPAVDGPPKSPIHQLAQ